MLGLGAGSLSRASTEPFLLCRRTIGRRASLGVAVGRSLLYHFFFIPIAHLGYIQLGFNLHSGTTVFGLYLDHMPVRFGLHLDHMPVRFGLYLGTTSSSIVYVGYVQAIFPLYLGTMASLGLFLD